MQDKEIEWTIIFDFPRDELDDRGYIPMNDGTFEPFNIRLWNLKNAKVWNNKEEAKKFAREKAGKYGWYLFPTVIEHTIY